MAVRGFCLEVCKTGLVTLLQMSVPDAVRGRLMSTQFLLQQGARSAGVALIGYAAMDWGLRLPLFCAVAIAALAWAAAFRSRHAITTAFALPAAIP